jgi:hypothetical protein
MDPTWTDIREFGKPARDAGKRKQSAMENSLAKGVRMTV